MAPEQWSGGVVDGKLDQYALGIVFYQMLAGTPPFQGDSMENLFVQHRDSPMPALPAGLGVPGAVERVIRRATEKTTEARFPSANDMAGPLEGSLSRTPDNLGFCPQCGQPVTRSTSRFCSSCGAELSAPKRLIDDEDRRGEDYVDKEPTGSVTPSQDSATGGEEPAQEEAEDAEAAAAAATVSPSGQSQYASGPSWQDGVIDIEGFLNSNAKLWTFLGGIAALGLIVAIVVASLLGGAREAARRAHHRP